MPRLDADPEGQRVFDNFIPEPFHSNLEKMVAILQQNHIRTLLVTRPTVIHLGMNQEDLDRNHVFFPYYAGTYSLERFLGLHRAYNSVTKQIAATHGITVVDLDMIFNLVPKDQLFIDTMHLSEGGNQLVADSLANVIASLADKPSDVASR